MSDRPCFVARTRHGCIAAVAGTRESCVVSAQGLRFGAVRIEPSTVVSVRSGAAGKWAYECEVCRQRRGPAGGPGEANNG